MRLLFQNSLSFDKAFKNKEAAPGNNTGFLPARCAPIGACEAPSRAHKKSLPAYTDRLLLLNSPLDYQRP